MNDILNHLRKTLKDCGNLTPTEAYALFGLYDELRSGHCKDCCCCARSWEALGITENDYEVGGIPEHIKQVRLELSKAEAILRRLAETEDLDELIIIANEAVEYFKEKEKG